MRPPSLSLNAAVNTLLRRGIRRKRLCRICGPFSPPPQQCAAQKTIAGAIAEDRARANGAGVSWRRLRWPDRPSGDPGPPLESYYTRKRLSRQTRTQAWPLLISTISCFVPPGLRVHRIGIAAGRVNRTEAISRSRETWRPRRPRRRSRRRSPGASARCPPRTRAGETRPALPATT